VPVSDTRRPPTDQCQSGTAKGRSGKHWRRAKGMGQQCCTFTAWSLTYKKALHAAEQNRPDVAEKRAYWPEQLAGVNPARLVFVDESGANTQMTRWRGRAPASNAGENTGKQQP